MRNKDQKKSSYFGSVQPWDRNLQGLKWGQVAPVAQDLRAVSSFPFSSTNRLMLASFMGALLAGQK